MSRKKFVVYTVFTGGVLNELTDPFPDDAGDFDRICFTDDVTINSKRWNLVYLDPPFLDATRTARSVKMLPHRYLPEYEWSLYLDTTIRFKRSPLELFHKYAGNDKHYWCVPHPWRNCIYDEAEEVIQLGYDDEKRVREQMDFYRRTGYPKNNGLIASGVLLRKHNQDDVVRFNELWLWHVLRYSKRDQLSFSFLANKLQLDFSLFDLNLIENEYWVWPGFSVKKLPNDFDEHVYKWLNPEVNTSNISPAKHFLTIGAAKSLTYTTKKWQLTQLANKYQTNKGNYYYNKHNYTSVYECLFQHIRAQPLRILVLGLSQSDVQINELGGSYSQAPSLQMWREYFPNAEIVGFDIQDFSAVAPMPNVHIVQGDLENRSALLDLTQQGHFDIIIDDASKASHHQQIALSVLYPYLKEGGFYAIENLDFQPHQIERTDAPKTKVLLKLMKLGIFEASPYISRATLAEIYAHCILQFYDSFDINFRRTSDSLVVIQKCLISSQGRFPLRRRVKLWASLIRSYIIKILINVQKAL